MQDTLLQAKADTVAAGINAAAAAPQEIKLWDMIVKGGPLMIPLGILSVIAVYVFVERYLTISRAGKLENNFMPMVRDHITSGNISAARSLA